MHRNGIFPSRLLARLPGARIGGYIGPTSDDATDVTSKCWSSAAEPPHFLMLLTEPREGAAAWEAAVTAWMDELRPLGGGDVTTVGGGNDVESHERVALEIKYFNHLHFIKTRYAYHAVACPPSAASAAFVAPVVEDDASGEA